MNKRTKLIAGGAAGLAIAAGGTGIAVAGSSDDDSGDSERAITGSALERAEEAALAHTGEGPVTETEVGDEESYYEVEVTLDDGSETDVQLDRGFGVVGDESDAGESGDD